MEVNKFGPSKHQRQNINRFNNFIRKATATLKRIFWLGNRSMLYQRTPPQTCWSRVSCNNSDRVDYRHDDFQRCGSHFCPASFNIGHAKQEILPILILPFTRSPPSATRFETLRRKGEVDSVPSLAATKSFDAIFY
ncbi:hypothetical protein BGZ99_003209, partial [Dissophora globulifera]